MNTFLQQFGGKISGVLHGFDRVIFKGSLMGCCYLEGVEALLATHHVLYKDFTAFAESLSEEIKSHARRLAEDSGCPYQYLSSPSISKKEVAEKIVSERKIKEGLVCILSCVEPCSTFGIQRDKERKHLVLCPQNRQCLHLYFYYLDKQFGLIHVRLQTWLPFTIKVYLNGREYVAARLKQLGISFTKKHNCFTSVANFCKAQKVFEELEKKHWEHFLGVLARRVNPLLCQRRKVSFRGYYWTIGEAEYATDIVFNDANSLAEIYPSLTHFAIEHFQCRDVLRFLGKGRPSHFRGDSNGTLVHRPEGVCVKHRVDENSIKMYDKEKSVLRIETTINNPRRFKVWRKVNPRQACKWTPMRRGIADLSRRIEISRAANERYLEALAIVHLPAPAKKILEPLTKRTMLKTQPVRGLNPVSAHDGALFEAVLDGKFIVSGFKNRDIVQKLCRNKDQPRAAAQITRRLRILRGHGLITKLPKMNHYRITKYGFRTITAALRLREANLTDLAA